MIDKERLPRHVAIIMDGNGRWARKQGQQRSWGHRNGVTTVHDITEAASDLGIAYLTLYTFSTENWNRPQEEVNMLMHLIVSSIEEQTPELIRKRVRLRVIGDMSRVPDFARERLERCIADTSAGDGMVLTLAISYSSRWEIVQACRNIAARVAAGEVTPDGIDEAMLSGAMATADMPDPDLLIRTGGDIRVSNYLLWQIAYSELVFSQKYWPEFTVEDFEAAIVEYQGRQRRYGKTGEQVEKEVLDNNTSVKNDKVL